MDKSKQAKQKGNITAFVIGLIVLLVLLLLMNYL